MNDRITATAKIYDDYVKYYNESGSSISAHISVLADCLRIEETLKDRTSEFKEAIEELIISIIDQIKAIPEQDLTDKKGDNNINSKLELKNEIISYITNLVENSFIYSLGDIAYLEAEIDKFFDGIVNRGHKSNIDFAFTGVKIIIPRFIRSQHHKAALWNIKDKIIDDYYPKKLPFYNELPEDEKSKIRSNGNRLGAPLTEDVPQEEIEEIINKLLKNYKQGKKIETVRNGQKMRYQVVHEGGKHEGRANINQIFKYFENANPHLINITGRQFKERIKKALPEDMK